MKLKKFIAKLDKLYLFGKKSKSKDCVKVNYSIKPEGVIAFSISKSLVEDLHVVESIRDKKQRKRVYKKIRRSCKKSILTEKISSSQLNEIKKQ